MKSKLRGLGVAMVTPFKEDLSVDYAGLKRMVEHISTGADYLVVQGTTGESVTCSKEEKTQILKAIQAANVKNLPIVYGIGGNNTLKIIDEIRDTDFTGIDAILSVCPYYNKPGKSGVIQHYTMIADVCPVPVIMYNIPPRTGINIAPSTIAELAKHPNIIGVKEASCVIEQCMEINRDCPEDFLLISGDDIQALPIMAVGGVGVMSVIGNAYPVEFGAVVHAALDNDFAKARKLVSRFLAIDSLLYEEGNPVGIKQILETKGIIKAHVRMPLFKCSEDLAARQLAVLKQEGLI